MLLRLSNSNFSFKERNEHIMLDKIALAIAIIGGINWGSVGLFQFDIVSWICGGSDTVLARIIFTLVGISALWCISLLVRDRTEVFKTSKDQ